MAMTPGYFSAVLRLNDAVCNLDNFLSLHEELRKLDLPTGKHEHFEKELHDEIDQAAQRLRDIYGELAGLRERGDCPPESGKIEDAAEQVIGIMDDSAILENKRAMISGVLIDLSEDIVDAEIAALGKLLKKKWKAPFEPEGKGKERAMRIA